MKEKYNLLRDKIFEYVSTRYQSEIEFPWKKLQNYCVFRHKDNNKWYGLIMDIPYAKLGVDKKGVTDILNVKIDEFSAEWKNGKIEITEIVKDGPSIATYGVVKFVLTLEKVA